MIYGIVGGGMQSITAATSAAFLATQSADRQFLSRLLAPAGADVIDVFFYSFPNEAWRKEIDRASRPAIVVVGDDPGNADGLGGPDAWRCTGRLRRWTRAAFVHAAGAMPEHYAGAVMAARKVGRLTLIETTSKHALAWAERLACRRTTLLLPRTGTHPIPAEAVH